MMSFEGLFIKLHNGPKGTLFGWVNILLLSTLIFTPMGCSIWEPPATFSAAGLRARSVQAEQKGVKMRAAVLSTEDSQNMFGVDINQTGVQPVWIEIENTTQKMLWLLRSGTDPNIFSPGEVAWSFHKPLAVSTNALLDDYFDTMGFQNPIFPGKTQSGILFTNPHHQTKWLNVDLLGSNEIFAFTLIPPVPDDTPDELAITVFKRFDELGADDYQNEEAFRAKLEQLACCTEIANVQTLSDPINVVLVGKFADLASALVRRGFRKMDLELDQKQRVFDRKPDIVLRKTGRSGGAANWMRLWLVPFRYKGSPVFFVQAGRPKGGRFKSSDNDDLELHPNVDEARNLLVQDLLYSGGLEKIGYLSGMPGSQPKSTGYNYENKHYYSDGLRVVLFIVTRPLSLSDVKILDWEPYLKQREADALTDSNDDKN